MKITVLWLVASAGLWVGAANAEEWSVLSPNGQVKLSVQLGKKLSYRVEQGTEGHRAVVVGDSPLGLRLGGQNFVEDLRFEAASPQKQFAESYTLLHGKRRECQNQGTQVTLSLRNPAGQPLELELRVYNDGVAFRYRLPRGAAGSQTLEAEATGFALPAGAKLWCAPSDKASTYSPGYETYYENGMDLGTVAPLGLGWSFPMLFRTADSQRWALITEAGVDETFCGTRLSSAPTNGAYTITLPNPAEGNGHGFVNPSATLPWEMPWRVIIVGNSLATIVESTLVTDVSAPSRVQDSSWIRPGRVAWSWWSDNPSPKDAVKQKQFVDLAAEMGWEYMLVDANWTIIDNGSIHDVLRYAKSKGVGVLLWYNSGGPHNVVTEKPRDCLTYPKVRKFELELLREWGVKGIKVDFFQSDKQEVMGIYQGILREAAEQHIMLNFHGCTLPRGWERTYPHLMSMEAVRGAECYIFDAKYPESAPVQNSILPFTRNAIGPMDFTPVTFSDNRYPHLTTWGHELALSVVFESGWVHFADKAEAYLGLPAEAKQFLKEVPVTWDETRFVEGYPGQYAILARRKNNTWYVAGVNGQSQVRETKVQLGNCLKPGSYDLTLIADGAGSRSFDSATRQFEPGQGFAVKMLPRGGFVAVLKRRD